MTEKPRGLCGHSGPVTAAVGQGDGSRGIGGAPQVAAAIDTFLRKRVCILCSEAEINAS